METLNLLQAKENKKSMAFKNLERQSTTIAGRLFLSLEQHRGDQGAPGVDQLHQQVSHRKFEEKTIYRNTVLQIDD